MRGGGWGYLFPSSIYHGVCGSHDLSLILLPSMVLSTFPFSYSTQVIYYTVVIISASYVMVRLLLTL